MSSTFIRRAVMFALLNAGLWFAFALPAGRAAPGPVSPAASSVTRPLPGQIIIDPGHPQSLMRQGGQHVFICGPGDPEDFLYVGRRNPDGTRDGDQIQRIEKLIAHGGNCIYMQCVRTHGGDAKGDKTQNPFVDSDPTKALDQRILDQWEQWFTLMDRNNILIYLLFYDDSARIWDTGDRVESAERAFVEGIVAKFKHHRNLIWIVGEESEERYTSARVQAIGGVIRRADEPGHLIGNHHLNGTTFKAWRPGGALNHFSMQLAKTDDEGHAGAIAALAQAAGRYQIIYSESTAMRTDVDGMRHHAWSVAMGGLMPMLLRMDIVSTPVEALSQCRTLQQFFERTDFYTMVPSDDLRPAGTKYVLADRGRSYIVYAENLTGPVSLEGLPAGRCEATWMDCQTGQTAIERRAFANRGRQAFSKPANLGQECAVWVLFPDIVPAKPTIFTSAETPQSPPEPNQPPVAKDRQLAITPGAERYIQLEFSDPDGPGPYTYTIVSAPTQGELSGQDNDRLYRAKSDFSGTDRFTWKVNDGQTDSGIATVTITANMKKAGQPAGRPQGYFPPPDVEGGWRTLKNADEIRRVAGMDQKKLDEAFQLIQGSTKNGGLLVARNGWLVYERYFGKGHREAIPNLASCGKSFTSVAVGILMAERPDLFPDGLEQKVFTPDYFPPEAFPLSDARKKDIKLGQLLTFSAGIRGNNPAYVQGKPTTIEPIGPDGWPALVDATALGKQDGTTGKTRFSTTTLWCDPGEGYSYASSSIHLASIMLRHVTGGELQDYVDKHLAKPLGWGQWGYGYKNAKAVTHTPGGGGIALRATDMLRFGYLLLHEGRWNDRQIVPAEYIRQCARQSQYNPHYPYSLQFDVNSDGDIPELPRDAFWKSGSGGHALYVVPSLDLVVWKLGGRDEQYSSPNTGLAAHPDAVRAVDPRKGWTETVEKQTALRKTLQLVIASITDGSKPAKNERVSPPEGEGRAKATPGVSVSNPPYPDPDWPVTTDWSAVQTMPERLEAYRRWLSERCGDSWAAVVIKGGYLVFAGHGPSGGVRQRNDCGSNRKSLQSTVLGVALEQGRLKDLDENAIPFWKDSWPTGYDNDRNITFRQFATFQDRWNEEARPGTFRYNNSGATAGGACIAGLFGEVRGPRPGGIAEVARREVMERIGTDWKFSYGERNFTADAQNPEPVFHANHEPDCQFPPNSFPAGMRLRGRRVWGRAT